MFWFEKFLFGNFFSKLVYKFVGFMFFGFGIIFVCDVDDVFVK